MQGQMDERYPIEIANILQKSILLLIFIPHSLVLIQANFSTLRFANFFLSKLILEEYCAAQHLTPLLR